MIDPRLAVLRDWLDVQIAPAPDIDDILRRLEDEGQLRAGLDTDCRVGIRDAIPIAHLSSDARARALP